MKDPIKHSIQQAWAVLLLLLVITGCTDDTFVEPNRAVVDENGMVHLKIDTNVPGLKLTRAVDINGERIETLWLIAFNEDGYMISRVMAQQTNDVVDENGGTGTFTAEVPSSTRRLHFLANVNMDNFSDQDNIGRHENEVIAPLVSSSGNLVYWGREPFENETELTNFAASSTSTPVILYRNQALVKYELTPTNNVQLEVLGWAICNQYAYGTVAPFNATADNLQAGDGFLFALDTNDFVTTLPEEYNVKMSDDNDVGEASGEEGDARYIFETTNPENDQVYAIMRIRKNNGNPLYYKIMLVNGNKEPYQIIRNHLYNIQITDINESYGVDNFAAAKNATPANNPWITISDEIPEVNNGGTTLRIEGETTVLYQEAGEKIIEFYYNGSDTPKVTWINNEGVATGEPAVTWNSSTGKGTITIQVNDPAKGRLTRGTLQVKEDDGPLSRRIQVITSEPFEFSPVWVSSEIPLLDNENITVLFHIPKDFPEELLPIEVKFGCDLIDAQTNQPLAVVMEENIYTINWWNEDTEAWQNVEVKEDWNYKYVYTADHVGEHRVNFRTILTELGNVEWADEFHIYMEGDDPRTGEDLFRQRDLYFAFQQPSDGRRRILLNDGDAGTKYATRTIEELDPMTGETIEIPFTLGTLSNENNPADGKFNSATLYGSGSTIWVYYDESVLKPSWTGATTGTDMYGNHYAVYTATTAGNILKFTSISPIFDSYVVLSARSAGGYPTSRGFHMEGNVQANAFRSASVTLRTSGRMSFSPEMSLEENGTYTSITNGGSFPIPYGIGQDVYLRILIPEKARQKAFTFNVKSENLTPAGEDWTQNGTTWSYQIPADGNSTQTFHFTTNRLASSETITLSTGNEVGFETVTVNMVNQALTGTIQLPEGVTFQISNPYIILERKRDGTRIGTFAITGDPKGQNSANYTLTLRGEYNLNAWDDVTIKWEPVSGEHKETVYSYSCQLQEIMTEDAKITLSANS